jgi:hypothetical protein
MGILIEMSISVVSKLYYDNKKTSKYHFGHYPKAEPPDVSVTHVITYKLISWLVPHSPV